MNTSKNNIKKDLLTLFIEAGVQEPIARFDHLRDKLYSNGTLRTLFDQALYELRDKDNPWGFKAIQELVRVIPEVYDQDVLPEYPELRPLLSLQELFDLFSFAVEGGKNYWGYIKDTGEIVKSGYEATCPIFKRGRSTVFRDLFTVRVFETLYRGIKVEIRCEHTNELLGHISWHNMQKGLHLLSEANPDAYGEIREGYYDAEDADVWFQCSVMGEIVFG